MIEKLKGSYGEEGDAYVTITRKEYERVNHLLDLFDHYVQHICNEEGTNYIIYSSDTEFTEAERDIINSIHRGDLDTPDLDWIRSQHK